VKISRDVLSLAVKRQVMENTCCNNSSVNPGYSIFRGHASNPPEVLEYN
jgi:hypothetical protein